MPGDIYSGDYSGGYYDAGDSSTLLGDTSGSSIGNFIADVFGGMNLGVQFGGDVGGMQVAGTMGNVANYGVSPGDVPTGYYQSGSTVYYVDPQGNVYPMSNRSSAAGGLLSGQTAGISNTVWLLGAAGLVAWFLLRKKGK